MPVTLVFADGGVTPVDLMQLEHGPKNFEGKKEEQANQANQATGQSRSTATPR